MKILDPNQSPAITRILSETMNAYADMFMPWNEACDIRQLQFKAHEPCTPSQAREIMRLATPHGYNNFNHELLSLFPPSCEVSISREYSVCLYVRGENLPSMDELGADSYDVEPFGWTRIWWD